MEYINHECLKDTLDRPQCLSMGGVITKRLNAINECANILKDNIVMLFPLIHQSDS